jgi:hypothetical protein
MSHGVQGRAGSARLDAPTAQQIADTMQLTSDAGD